VEVHLTAETEKKLKVWDYIAADNLDAAAISEY
jgi:hypothetical protein